jgi:hypothetical protein
LNVDPARGVFSPDLIGAGGDTDVCHVAEAHMTAICGIEQQIADAGEAMARLRDRPHHHVIHFAVAVDVRHFFARKDHRSGTAHIAWLQPELCRLGEIHRDLDLRDLLLRFLVQIDHALDAGQSLFDPRCLFPENIEFLSEDAHHDRFT